MAYNPKGMPKPPTPEDLAVDASDWGKTAKEMGITDLTDWVEVKIDLPEPGTYPVEIADTDNPFAYMDDPNTEWIDDTTLDDYIDIDDPAFDLDKPLTKKGKPASVKDDDCIADPLAKVMNGKIFWKQKGKYSSQVVHGQMLSKPEWMEAPKAPECVCADCVQDYKDQEQAYAEYQEEMMEYQENVQKAQIQALKDDADKKAAELAKKKQIALDYLAQEEAKKAAKKPIPAKTGNPLLLVQAQQSVLQKIKPDPNESHAKGQKYGGVSSYTDNDVESCREYMQEVLKIESMSINGRALEHVLAEICGFATRDLQKRLNDVQAKEKNQQGLEATIKSKNEVIVDLSNRNKDLANKVAVLESEKEALKVYETAAKKIDKEAVAKTSTGRRIKDA